MQLFAAFFGGLVVGLICSQWPYRELNGVMPPRNPLTPLIPEDD